MTALSANRKENWAQLGGIGITGELTVYNAEILYEGGLVAIDYTDEIQMAAATEGLRTIGVCGQKVDNTSDGEVLKELLRGIFPFNNSSSYAIPRSAIGQVAYVEDDNTVASYNATAYVPAGIIHDVDSDWVWVEVTPRALVLCDLMCHHVITAKTDNYTVTAAQAFARNNIFTGSKNGGMEFTLPSAVGGYRVGIKRLTATASYDVTIQAAAGDKIEASDGLTAAGKQIDNTVDAVGEVLWLRAADDTHWLIDNPVPNDVGNWVINDA